MPEAGHAMLHVYDLSGQQVATLAEGHLEAGEYRLAWDLRSAAGLPVPSGSYTCVISSGGRIGFTRLEVVSGIFDFRLTIFDWEEKVCGGRSEGEWRDN